MTFWSLTSYSDFPTYQTFHQFLWPWYLAWPSPNYEWFPWSICNGCGMPAGNAYSSGHLVLSPFWGLAYVPIVETSFPELAMSFLDFSPWISLGTLSTLLWVLECHGESHKSGSCRFKAFEVEQRRITWIPKDAYMYVVWDAIWSVLSTFTVYLQSIRRCRDPVSVRVGTSKNVSPLISMLISS